MGKHNVIVAYLFVCVLLSGCVSMETIPEGASSPSAPKGLTHISNVRPGLTSREVAVTMGEKTTIGYERPDPTSATYHAITVNNPYHKEFLKSGDKTYDVFYYFSHIQRADGIISSDELTPLVFENDILIGKGWDFLNKLKNPQTAK